MPSTLYYGDCLNVLRKHFADESVDLIYLDPPFNSRRDYNVLFREKSGHESPAQIKAFGDTWNWAGAADAWADFLDICPIPKLYELMHGFKNAIGVNDVFAYLVMMAPRLYQLSRVLKPTGTIYLHCDPTASHYLKLVMDCIFGAKNFKNEIVWQRVHAKGNVQRKYGAVHDIVLCYAKQRNRETWNQVYSELREDYIEKTYRHVEAVTGRRYSLDNLTASMQRASQGQIYEWRGKTPPPSRCWVYAKDKMDALDAAGRVVFSSNGYPRYKRYLDENMGEKITDIWSDIFQLSPKESLGYPTQKPVSLLERIILASSNPGDIILDPFCGCGTAVVAAEKLGREWRGIDITSLATTLVQYRLLSSFGARDVRLVQRGATAERVFEVDGLPTDLTAAREMYERDRLHKSFEMWAVGLIPAYPQESKGADSGIDGLAYFDEKLKKLTKSVVQVKGGHVTANQVRDLRGVMARDSAQMGFFVTLERSTRPMRDEAINAGFYQPSSGFGKRVHALQIRTIEELLNGREFDIPIYGSNVTYKQAGVVRNGGIQAIMEMPDEDYDASNYN